MPSPMTTTDIRRAKARRRLRRGQALVEAMVGVVLFIYLGLMGYDIAILQHNLTLIQETTREAAWVGARQGSDERVLEMLEEAGRRLITGAFLTHDARDFGLEVWRSDTWAVTSEAWIMTGFGADTTFAPGARRHAPHVYRAQGYVLRLGLRYVISLGAPMFGVFRPFTVSIPIVANEPFTVRNDEDRDGLADLYEQEVFARAGLIQSSWRYCSWPTTAAGDTMAYFPFSHTDSGGYVGGYIIAVSDAASDNIDGDTLSNDLEANLWKHAMYDHDNDGVEDRHDFVASPPAYRDPTDTKAALPRADSPQLLVHPVFGGQRHRVQRT